MRITATEAARTFSDRLDEVEHAGRVFEISRRGRPVALLTPATSSTRTRRTWGEAIRMLLDGPRADDDFARDMEEIRASQGSLPSDPWAR